MDLGGSLGEGKRKRSYYVWMDGGAADGMDVVRHGRGKRQRWQMRKEIDKWTTEGKERRSERCVQD